MNLILRSGLIWSYQRLVIRTQKPRSWNVDTFRTVCVSTEMAWSGTRDEIEALYFEVHGMLVYKQAKPNALKNWSKQRRSKRHLEQYYSASCPAASEPIKRHPEPKQRDANQAVWRSKLKLLRFYFEAKLGSINALHDEPDSSKPNQLEHCLGRNSRRFC